MQKLHHKGMTTSSLSSENGFPQEQLNNTASQNKPVLPPLATLSSPSDSSYVWSFPTPALSNSLRASPLSPAMPRLAGLQDPQSPFPTDFRRGINPRTGLTYGSRLSPLLTGPISFPPPSPNTTAFLSMMDNPNTPSSPPAADRISFPPPSPNTVAFLSMMNNP